MRTLAGAVGTGNSTVHNTLKCKIMEHLNATEPHYLYHFFIDGNLFGLLYLQVLEEAITPRIAAVVQNNVFDYDPIFQ